MHPNGLPEKLFTIRFTHIGRLSRFKTIMSKRNHYVNLRISWSRSATMHPKMSVRLCITLPCRFRTNRGNGRMSNLPWIQNDVFLNCTPIFIPTLCGPMYFIPKKYERKMTTNQCASQRGKEITLFQIGLHRSIQPKGRPESIHSATIQPPICT